MAQPERTPHSELDDLLDRGFRYAVALTHDAAQAEDIVQEACLRMVKKQQPWHAPYFLATIRNHFIELYRRKKRFPLFALDEVPSAAITERQAVRDDAAIVADTDSLEKALARLKAGEREMVYLFVVEGYTAREISEMTGRPRNTVLSVVHRARKKLRSLLEAEAAELSPWQEKH